MWISLIIKLTSKGPILYWSDRVGLESKIFRMPKFRTMSLNTPELASDLLKNPTDYITPFGRFLRRTSLDELPQIISVFLGDMSFVGPRPALFNQYELIELRRKALIDTLLPGITGLAQISGRDELSIEEKVLYDKRYLHDKSLLMDLKIIFFTFYKVIKRSGVKH